MRIALISDIHEDIVNLRFAFDKIEKKNCDEVVCLGDISGFSAPHYNYYNTRNASECLKLIKQNCSIIIKGNHDIHAAKQIPTINPDFEYPDDWYSLDYHRRMELSEGKVWLYDYDELSTMYRSEDIDFITSLNEFEIQEVEGSTILYAHYCFPNITGSGRLFYHETEEFELHKAFVGMQGGTISFVGHRHFAGLLVASYQKIVEKRYQSKYYLTANDCVFVPPITGKRLGNGFCIFDTSDFTVEAYRI